MRMISADDIDTYTIRDGRRISGIKLGEKTPDGGFEYLLEVVTTNGFSLDNVVCRKSRTGNVYLTSAPDCNDGLFVVRFNCFEPSLGHHVDREKAYGAIYVPIEDQDRVWVLANGHAKIYGRKQNDAILIVSEGAKVFVRYINGDLKDGRVFRFRNVDGETKISKDRAPSHEDLHMWWSDICSTSIERYRYKELQ